MLGPWGCFQDVGNLRESVSSLLLLPPFLPRGSQLPEHLRGLEWSLWFHKCEIWDTECLLRNSATSITHRTEEVAWDFFLTLIFPIWILLFCKWCFKGLIKIEEHTNFFQPIEELNRYPEGHWKIIVMNFLGINSNLEHIWCNNKWKPWKTLVLIEKKIFF